MRQVPVFSSFLVIGNGRVARHICHYFSFENIPFHSWHRELGQSDLEFKLRETSHVLLLISDRAIAPFYAAHPALNEKQCVHFSGSLIVKGVAGAHPLMTFSDASSDSGDSNELYDLETYRNIPFIIERGGPAFQELLPGLKNRSYEIEPEQKGLYHALCALAGNFTVMLWEKAFRDFSLKLGLPRDVLTPYLNKTAENLARAKGGKSVLTGPLVRRDQPTIDKHLRDLNDDPYHDVYAAFVAAYSTIDPTTPPKESAK